MADIAGKHEARLTEAATAALEAGRRLLAPARYDQGKRDAVLRPDIQDGDLVALPGDPLEFAGVLSRDWAFLRRREQAPPPGDWRSWLILGGRGSGKTRAGAEWVHELATRHPNAGELRIALVAETLGDAREVMIDGASGICRIARAKRPDFETSRRRLVWPSGAMAQIFSSEDPESLRGPQFHFAWCDELAKWKYAQECWDMLQFGLRLGARPRQLVTTTPRPVPLLKALMADPETALTRISTSANRANLAPGFIEALASRYGGSRLGRQELDGELIEDRDDALWKRETIEALTLRAEADPSREAGAIRERIAEQVRLLMDASANLDASRLHMEAAFLATKADIREEIDRLKTHVASGRGLLKGGGAIGRKLDFLAQEFNRESNTLCSKSNAAAVTAIGLELKAVVDQFREQVQNLE